MKHVEEEQLIDVYYGDVDTEVRHHLEECADCRGSFERLKELLDSARDYPVPERGNDYGREVWARLLPRLTQHKQGWSGFRGWALAPATAVLVVLAFVAGLLIHRQPAGLSAQARERMFLLAMSDHLERSQIVLTELLNTVPSHVNIADQRERAQGLVNENRLLRQAALHMGDAPDAALLDDLERVLLNVANSPADLTPDEVDMLQRRIEQQGLLFKVRVTSTDAREKGQKL